MADTVDVTYSGITKELVKSIKNVQQSIGIIGKDADNPYHKSKYASLEHIWEVIKPELGKNNLTVVQLPVSKEDKAGVRTLILHESGGVLAAELLLPIPEKGLGAQGVGSCISYARRYSLTAALGIVVGDEDDDGEAAEGRSGKPGANRKPESQNKGATPKPGLADRKAAVLAYIATSFKVDTKGIQGWIEKVLNRKVEDSLSLKNEGELIRLEEEVEKLKAMDAGMIESYLKAKGVTNG